MISAAPKSVDSYQSLSGLIRGRLRSHGLQTRTRNPYGFEVRQDGTPSVPGRDPDFVAIVSMERHGSVHPNFDDTMARLVEDGWRATKTSGGWVVRCAISELAIAKATLAAAKRKDDPELDRIEEILESLRSVGTRPSSRVVAPHGRLILLTIEDAKILVDRVTVHG